MRVLALDCGGTDTTALVIDDDGKLLEEWRSGPANLKSHGADGVAELIHRLATDVRPDLVAAGVAGVRTEEDRGELADALARRGMDRAVILSDVHAAFYAAGLDWGVVAVAGTGSAVLARGPEGEVRVGGWGPTVGDRGSAYEAGRAILSLAVRDWDAGVTTDLVGLVLRHWGLHSMDDVRGVVRAEDAVARIAALTSVAAACRDPRINAIVEGARDGIVDLIRTAARRSGLGPVVPVVVTGGMWRAFPELQEGVAASLGRDFRVRLLERSPAWGAFAVATGRSIRLP